MFVKLKFIFQQFLHFIEFGWHLLLHFKELGLLLKQPHLPLVQSVLQPQNDIPWPPLKEEAALAVRFENSLVVFTEDSVNIRCLLISN